VDKLNRARVCVERFLLAVLLCPSRPVLEPTGTVCDGQRLYIRERSTFNGLRLPRESMPGLRPSSDATRGGSCTNDSIWTVSDAVSYSGKECRRRSHSSTACTTMGDTGGVSESTASSGVKARLGGTKKKPAMNRTAFRKQTSARDNRTRCRARMYGAYSQMRAVSLAPKGPALGPMGGRRREQRYAWKSHVVTGRRLWHVGKFRRSDGESVQMAVGGDAAS